MHTIETQKKSEIRNASVCCYAENGSPDGKTYGCLQYVAFFHQKLKYFLHLLAGMINIVRFFCLFYLFCCYKQTACWYCTHKHGVACTHGACRNTVGCLFGLITTFVCTMHNVHTHRLQSNVIFLFHTPFISGAMLAIVAFFGYSASFITIRVLARGVFLPL